jgi:flagellar hook-length control protein FliK
MMTDVTAGLAPTKGAGGARLAALAGSEGSVQQFSDKLQGVLQAPDAEVSLERNGVELSGEFAGDAAADGVEAFEGLGAELQTSADDTDLALADTVLAFADAQGVAVPGQLSEAWQVDAGLGAGSDEGAVLPADAPLSAVPGADGQAGVPRSNAQPSGPPQPKVPQAGALAAGEPSVEGAAFAAGLAVGGVAGIAGHDGAAQSVAGAGDGHQDVVSKPAAPAPVVGPGQGKSEDALPGFEPRDVKVSAANTDGLPAKNAAQDVEAGGRRWQAGLPQELRAGVAPVSPRSGGPVLSVQAESAQTVKVAAGAGLNVPGDDDVLAVKQVQEPGAGIKQRVWRTDTGTASSSPVAEVARTIRQAAGVRGAPDGGAGQAVSSTADKVVVTVPANGAAINQVSAAVSQGQAGSVPNKILTEAAPKSVASVASGSGGDLEALPLAAVEGDDGQLEQRLSDEFQLAGPRKKASRGAQPAVTQAGAQVQTVNPQASGANLVSAKSFELDPAVDDVAEDDGVPPALDSDLDGKVDFAATMRGGEMQGAARTEALQTPNQVQSSHVATQVAVEMARNLKNAQTRFQMRFDPPELGRVDVNMKVAADGSVKAHLIVDRPETLDMFLRDQRGLERALEAAGLNADSADLQFSLRQDTGQQFASGDDQQQQNHAGQSGNGGGLASEDPAGGEALNEQILRMTLAEQRGGLDIRI